MAGEWRKIEHATPDKPEVWDMSYALNIDPDAVSGKLIRVWAWSSCNCPDSGRTSVRAKAIIDRITSVCGFADAMIDVGWLLVDGEELVFPNFEYHNSKTARSRALDQKRKQQSRQGVQDSSGLVPDMFETESGLEKRREEKSIKELPIVPQEKLYTQEFEAWWSIYPKKVSKGEAFKAFQKAKKRISIPDLMKATADRVQNWKAIKKEKKYIPNPATWLNADGWHDELEVLEDATMDAKVVDTRVSALVKKPDGTKAMTFSSEEARDHAMQKNGYVLDVGSNVWYRPGDPDTSTKRSPAEIDKLISSVATVLTS